MVSENVLEELDIPIRAWLDLCVRTSSIPGLSVAIWDGRSSKSWNFGICSVSENRPVEPSTRFDVASQTKVALLVAILRLCEAGSFNLYKPLSFYLPDLFDRLPNELASVTSWHVLTHRSRFPRDMAPRSRAESVIGAVEESLEWSGINNAPSYSNTAVALLALVIESVTGEDLETILSREVFVPLEMNNSTFGVPENIFRAEPHGPGIDGRRNLLTQDDFVLRGAVGLWSTTSDLCRLFSAFADPENDGFLTSRSKLTALASQWRSSSASEFGVGLEIKVMNGRRWHGHSGGAPGFVSATYFQRELGVAFSIAINARDIDVIGGIVTALVQLIELYHEPDTTNRTDSDELCGMFGSDIGYVQVITTPKGVYLLDAQKWNMFARAFRLTRSGTDEMRIAGDDFSLANTRIVFERDDDDNVVRLLQGPSVFEKVRSKHGQ